MNHSKIRKIGMVDGGFIETFGDLEIAYVFYGVNNSPIRHLECLPPRVFDGGWLNARTKSVGAFKKDGVWFVAATDGCYSATILVSKFKPVKERIPREEFLQLFYKAYLEALDVERRIVLEMIER